MQTKAINMNKKQNNAQESDFSKLATPAQRALANASIKNLRQLAKFSEAGIKEMHGIGPNALQQLRAALKAMGLSFTNKK